MVEIVKNKIPVPKKLKGQNKCHVRPVLEHSATAWAPHTQRNINKFESVSLTSSRKICYGKPLHLYNSVTTMLSNLKWDTLQYKRNILKLEMLFKIIHNLVELP